MRLLVLVLMAMPLVAQQFEVATLKLSPPPEGNAININLGRFQNGRLTMNNVTLSDMMKYAYALVSDAQLVVPDWSTQPRFDLEAKTEPGTPPAELHKMMQVLLAERLSVKLRREQRVLPHLALTVGRGGAKMKPASAELPTVPRPQLPGRIDHPSMPMLLLATLLSRFERQTVVDLTGLPGSYELTLEWTPENMSTTPVSPDAAPPDRPSLFTAMQEQLGLRLEARRSPLEVLIVESAAHEPASN